MFYAKSENEESIVGHTEELIKRLVNLKKLYGERILNVKDIEKDRFWQLLELACIYHDLGKVYTPFQNIILKKLKREQIPTRFSYEYIKHEQLSPAFIPLKKLNLSKEDEKILIQAIYYHHERKESVIDVKVIDNIIKEDISVKMNEIKEEIKYCINEEINIDYLKYISSGRRIKEDDEEYIKYILIKGLLHRLDHSASAHVKIEDDTKEILARYCEEYMSKLNYKQNNLQLFCKCNHENNIIVIGSTGMGKTEAALIWGQNDKIFFTLPLRVSINAIYDRILDDKNIGYKNVGLLHSTALDHLEEQEEIKYPELIYEQARNLSSKATICTIDQIFKFVFKFKGYEKIYATLSYSKIIIDEIQAYSPHIVAIILKGLEMINKIGGKYMIMTATLPGIYKEELEKRGMQFEFGKFLSNKKRHRMKLCEKEISQDIEEILEKGINGKVLIIVNTINKAIELYRELNRNGNRYIKLLHSRFIQEDRAKREKEIKEFSDSNNKGIWISTQIVEASLDIDFDYLFTEITTLDSLFQRFGRCYRKREYKEEKPNIYVYTENPSGVGTGKKSVYDKEIVEKSKNLLKKYDNEIVSEEDKVIMVEELYSSKSLKNTKFLEEFNSSMYVLDNIIDYEYNSNEIQNILRNIDSVKVMPKKIYEKNKNLIEEYHNCKDYKGKTKIHREIDKYTININRANRKKFSEYISSIEWIEDIEYIGLKYTTEEGLILEKDEEYELNERFDDGCDNI